MTRIFVALWLIGCLAWIGYIVAEIARDTTIRGRARVHAGRSWTQRP